MDRLTVEEVDKLRNYYVNTVPFLDTDAQFLQAYTQLADTMRENDILHKEREYMRHRNPHWQYAKTDKALSNKESDNA